MRDTELNANTGWSARVLKDVVSAAYQGESIVVLANREPIRHEFASDHRIVTKRSSGGLVTALEPLIEACSGVWVAHGAGTADRAAVETRDGLDVPSADSRYRLRRVWLDSREEAGFYYGFANEALWPLCHRTQVQPVFRLEDFQTYCGVNARFSQAVCEEVSGASPLVLVQDYHFMGAAQLIRRTLPKASIVTFWHIPFPGPTRFATCPWFRQLLEGMLGSTIVGFQTPGDCRNFVDTVEALLGARINAARDAITYRSREIIVRAYPVSVEYPSRWANRSLPIERCKLVMQHRLGIPAGIRVGIGVDRMDYTKGINEKFLAIERLLELHAELRGHFVFVQIAEPTRECLPAYRETRSRVLATAERINSRFGTPQYQPIVLLNTHFDPADIHLYLRSADLCYVGSLHDGMNLVAKEFVVARDDERGVLILSQFAGAAQQLDGVLSVDPDAIDECSAALLTALSMSAQDQAQRLQRMRSAVAQFDVYRWAGEILTDVARLRRQRDQSRRPSVGGTRSLVARRSRQNAAGGRRMSDVGGLR